MPTRIPLMQPWLGDEEVRAVAEALQSGWIAQGPRVEAFEAAFAETTGAVSAVAVSSCTAALHLALRVGGIGPGDDVVVPSLSFIATANVPSYVGARPVFADVDPCTQNVTAATVEAVLTPSTRAVIVVHQVGVPANMAALHALCDPREILVVEDAACAIGSTYHGRLIGTDSELVAFSFHPRKLVTTGEGGMLVSSRDDWSSRARALRQHGMSVSAAERHASDVPLAESYLEVGFNYRMTDLQAAVGLVQLAKLGPMVTRRREQAARYHHLLGHLAGVGLPDDPPWGTTNYQSFSITLPDHVDRDVVMARMLDDGIATRRGVMAAHLEPAYRGETAHLPVTERLTTSSLILPLFHALEPDAQAWIADRLAAALDDRPVR
jgi:dTDP-4-amino-4,6-dideoxygalactose transaminase